SGTKHGTTESALDTDVTIAEPLAIIKPTLDAEEKEVGGEGMVKCSTVVDVVQIGETNLNRRYDEKGSLMDPLVTLAETLASIKADLALDAGDDDFQQPLRCNKFYLLR
ncbi:unnamed protein product, partial [Linum tenue]